MCKSTSRGRHAPGLQLAIARASEGPGTCISMYAYLRVAMALIFARLWVYVNIHASTYIYKCAIANFNIK